MTNTVSVTQLRADFEKYVLAVEAGEHLIITRYGKPIAQLLPGLRSQIRYRDEPGFTGLDTCLLDEIGDFSQKFYAGEVFPGD